MNRMIAFLRAINVGGHNVKMEQLRLLFEEMGFSAVETFIASGNVIFDAASQDTTTLAKQIETRLHEALGYEVATFLRTPAELGQIARYPAFPAAELEAAGALNIAFLAHPPQPENIQKLMTLKTDIDDFHLHERELYWLCRTKQSDSTFSNLVLEKTLRQKATLRGYNTVRKLAEKTISRV